MSKEELLKKLKELATGGDPEGAHADADRLLLDFINDPAVTEAFDAIDKWYA
jgi:hypothetical protein